MTVLTEQLSARDKHKRQDIQNDLNDLLRIPQGRRALMWILEQCGVYQAVYTGDDAATNFNLGRRDVGLRLIALIETTDIEAYPRLLLARAQDQAATKGKVNVLDAETDE